MNPNPARALGVSLLAALLPATAGAQTIASQNFDGLPPFDAWTANGQQMIFGDANAFMGVPYLDFEGVTLSNSADARILGDLTRYGAPLTLEVDVRVFRLDNFFGDPIDPHHFPIVLELVDTDNYASVYTLVEGFPRPSEGWAHVITTISDPTSPTLPAGWGGTGDEDPHTFEPRLPPGRTFASVLRSVDIVRWTSFRPGYFYSANFWEVGFDNVKISRVAACDPDLNHDGNADQDDVAYLVSVIAGGPNPSGIDPDFNLDGNADQGDVAALVAAVAGGPCP